MKNLLTGYDFSFNQFGIDQSVSAGFSLSCPIDTTFCKIQSAILRAKWCTIVQTTMPTDNILSRSSAFDNNGNGGWDERFSVLKLLDPLKKSLQCCFAVASFNNIWNNTFITNLHLTT